MSPVQFPMNFLDGVEVGTLFIPSAAERFSNRRMFILIAKSTTKHGLSGKQEDGQHDPC